MPDDLWRGFSTVAGSWIGGGANQTAMKEMFKCGDELFSAMITVDVLVANVWMAFLLYGAGRAESVDRFFKADASAIEELKEKLINYQKSVAKMPELKDLMAILAVGLGVGLMILLDVTHPPAGGNPIIVILGSVSFDYLFSPILTGCLIIIVFAIILNKLVAKKKYT